MSDRYEANATALKIYGVTQKDYEDWCKTTKRPSYSNATKREFFTRLREGRLVKNVYGQLVRKNRKRK